MDENKKISAKLKSLRISKSIKQKEIASCLGLSENAYSRIENGVTHLTIDNLFRICEKLNLRVHEVLLLCDLDYDVVPAEIEKAQADSDPKIKTKLIEFLEFYELMKVNNL